MQAPAWPSLLLQQAFGVALALFCPAQAACPAFALQQALTGAAAGVSATAEIGAVTPQYDETVVLTGVEATVSIGTVKYPVIFNATGVSATVSIGQIELDVDDSVIPVGVAGTGAIGAVFISGWTQINDAQVPDWEEIDVAA